MMDSGQRKRNPESLAKEGDRGTRAVVSCDCIESSLYRYVEREGE